MKVEEKNKVREQIDEWKEQYGKIYKSVVGDKEYIWRRIKRSEYAGIMALKDGTDVDERIYNRQCAMVKTVVLNIDKDELEEELEELAGLAITISEEVLEKSGFNITETVEL